MLRFNNQQISEEHVHAKFQYILCYGSTLITISRLSNYINFNTSYVTVQLKWKTVFS